MSQESSLPVPAEPGLPTLKMAYGPEQRFDIAKLEPGDRKTVLGIAGRYPQLDGTAVMSFGADGQRATSRHLDPLMATMTAADVGAGGALLAEVATGIDMLPLADMKAEAEGRPKTLMQKAVSLPLIGKHLSAFARFNANRTAVLELFERIERQGEADLVKIKAYDVTLERMIETIEEGLARMRLELIAGQVILERERAWFKAARDAASAEKDPLVLAKLRDRAGLIDAFEVRLLRLNVAFTKSVTEIQRTRMVQQAGRSEYRNVLDTLLFDMPELKRRIITLAALRATRIAGEGADARRKLNATLDLAAMDELDRAYIGAKENESGVLAEVESLNAIAARLVDMVKRGSAIDQKNREERDGAHRRLADIRHDLGEGLAQALSDDVERIGHPR